MKRVDIARALVTLLKKKTDPKSIQSSLSRTLNGLRPMPGDWEQPLMTVLGCQDREAMRQLYPALYFEDEQKVKPRGPECEISITFSDTDALISVDHVPDVFRALQVLRRFGIKSDMHIRGIE